MSTESSEYRGEQERRVDRQAGGDVCLARRPDEDGTLVSIGLGLRKLGEHRDVIASELGRCTQKERDLAKQPRVFASRVKRERGTPPRPSEA